ncbi:DUF3710 domain-containing protein [Nocardioides perillae]|uniref:DUF3710 domain-containing protein n=1 Tax=Nocardioides perillae TaxID=1119534 RepID=A0A7Y9UKS8_9ACTN|nr:hypothetical protein [Nocardioides perillae]
MKFRRKSAAQSTDEAADSSVDLEGQELGEDEEVLVHGPVDADDLDLDSFGDEAPPWVDLGSLLITPEPGMQLRMQVDEQSQRVQAIILTGPDGALEVMAFAAPRGGGLWDEVRPQIAADMARRGGTATEVDGRWGKELDCRITVQRGDGSPATQPSRIIGIDGQRWMLRATLLGRPAVDREAAEHWEAVLANVVVRRGKEPMAVGDQLPVVLPPDARPVS